MRNGRPEFQSFAADERLYWRVAPEMCPQDEGDADWRPSVAAVRFPDMSVNRSRFSEPADVRIPNWRTWGVSSFAVEDVPPAVRTDEKTVYEFLPIHDPEETNYAHSEVRTLKNGGYSRDLKVAPTVKMQFRLHLRERLRLELPPIGGG